MSAQTEQTPRIAIRYRTWSELLVALKECQDSSLPNQATSFITQRVFDCLVEKLVSPTPSTTVYAFQFSSSARKPRKCSPTAWWFEDLSFLNVTFAEKLTKTMISRELDHGLVSKFLFHYRKSKLICAEPAERREISEAVIGLLCLLDGKSVSFKGLFSIYQAGGPGERVSERHRRALEGLIGSQLDRATLDYLLVPSPRGKSYVYDVNMVLELVKSFLLTADRGRLNKVGRLMDSYLSEVALDSRMKHSKFSALVTTLPDCARDSHDGLYQAMDMYFEVHSELCEESKMSLCCALNYEKLSREALRHLARNNKFPSRVSVKAFMAQSCKLTSLIREIYHLKSFGDHSWLRGGSIKRANDDGGENSEAGSREPVHRGSEVELKTTHSEMGCDTTSRISASGHGRFFPTFCGC